MRRRERRRKAKNMRLKGAPGVGLVALTHRTAALSVPALLGLSQELQVLIDTVQCSIVEYSTVQYSAVQYTAVLCSTEQWSSAVDCSGVYSAVQ
jgi:hypothetical protein